MEGFADAFAVTDISARRRLSETSTSSSVDGGSDNGLFYVPPGLVALLSVIYGSVSVVAVVGNLLVGGWFIVAGVLS